MGELLLFGCALAFVLGLSVSLPLTLLAQPSTTWELVLGILSGPLVAESIYLCLACCCVLSIACLGACLEEINENFDQMEEFLDSYGAILRGLPQGLEDPENPIEARVQRPFSSVKPGSSVPVVSMPVTPLDEPPPLLNDMSHLYPAPGIS